jgi:hypothetical protein
MTVWGILGALSVIVMDGFVIQNPGYAGIPTSASNISLVILAIIFVLGIIYFFGVKTVQRSRGLDLSLVFKEIPPS